MTEEPLDKMYSRAATPEEIRAEVAALAVSSIPPAEETLDGESAS